MDLRSKCHISWDSQWSLLLYLILKLLACEFYPKAATLTATTTITTTTHFVSHPSILTHHNVSTTPHSTLCQRTNCLCQNSNPLKHLLAAVIFYFFPFLLRCVLFLFCSFTNCHKYEGSLWRWRRTFRFLCLVLAPLYKCFVICCNCRLHKSIFYIIHIFPVREKTPSSSVLAPLITISIYFGYIAAQ